MIGRFDLSRTAAAGLALVLLPLSQAWAAGSCHVVARHEPKLVPAAAAHRLAEDELRLTFVGHATFLIESPGGVRVATDYNDYVRPEVVPDVATMNLAHSTHHSSNPDPAIGHVLRGWNPEGGTARHDSGSATSASAMCRPISATGREARITAATRSSCSSWPISASPISGTCTTG